LIINNIRKVIMSEGNAREISLGEHFGPVVVSVNGVRIEVDEVGHVAVSVPANDTLEIGAIESTGEHKGEIYGGIYPADNKPIWFLTAPRLMDKYAAAAWAKEQGGSLPARKQGDYLTTLKGKGGAFREIFNRGDSFPAGYVWLAELTWCQRLSDGYQYDFRRNYELPVLSVRR
jgi:hypothetical protein